SVVTKYHKGRHSLFLYNSEIFYAFTQDILRSLFWTSTLSLSMRDYNKKLVIFLASIHRITSTPYQSNLQTYIK
ncbi:hypothetical protein FH622_11335, partial [Levilactobacillus brevis]|nr:hypothetical protein [Levilactobacillus brevis]